MYGNNRGFGGQRSFSPVKVGQELDVKIEAVGEKGDGIAKEKGFVLFVPGAKQGDEVRIKVTKVLRKVGFAEVIGQATGQPSKDAEVPAEESTEKESSSEDEQYEESSSDTEEVKEEDSEDFGEEEKED
jgi:predicted RNA-binding protein with TRAM domain